MVFGKSATLFDEIRRRYYAPELMDAVMSLLAAVCGKQVIDSGHGTGISARELSLHRSEVTACSPEEA